MGKSDLNGAYYGPAVPPPMTYHRPGRGGGGCCCNPFTCCCSCIANLICTCVFQILCTILVVVGVIIFVLWLIFRPDVVRFNVNDAALTEFNLNNNNLQYNLTLDLSIRNPNRRISIYYDSIEARAFYEGQRFSAVELPGFYQGHRATNNLTADFSGQNILLLSGDGPRNYENDRLSSRYGINVRLFIRARLRFWIIRSMTIRPRINCNLEVPLITNNTSPGGPFQPQSCRFVWR